MNQSVTENQTREARYLFGSHEVSHEVCMISTLEKLRRPLSYGPDVQPWATKVHFFASGCRLAESMPLHECPGWQIHHDIVQAARVIRHLRVTNSPRTAWLT